MEPTPELIDDLLRDKALAARAMSPEDRFLAGPRLFELACEFVRAGIRRAHPEATEDEIAAMLRERLKLAHRLEEVA
ncbi:MAG TPA: hypothetical protein PLP66_07135 [Phycisphaerae bacterium]|nr:hypothetical protein [Phycisphaerae bacterium]HQL55344.1 hypothetical protein [Phycisphaerae bacterium]